MKFIYIITLLLLVSCENKNNFFNGEFIQSKELNDTINLNLKKIDINLIGVDFLTVIDTFIIAQTSNRNDYLLATYSTRNYELITRFLSKGNGNNEELFISYRDNYVNKNGDIKMWFTTFDKIKLVNIVESSKKGTVVVDSIINIAKLKSYGVNQYDILNDSILGGQKYNENDIKYVQYNIKTDSIIGEFSMYNTNNLNEELAFNNLRINNKVKKAASGMIFFDQINIFNINGHSNSAYSISVSKSPIQEQLVKNKTFQERTAYYRYIQVTDNYIFGSYSGKGAFDPCNIIHVFDWNGNLKFILNSNEDFTYFSIDEINNQIYLYGVNETCYLASLLKLGIL